MMAGTAALLQLSLVLFASADNYCNTEKHRPRYHYSPADNWMNGPNGLIYYNSAYHLYYQYNPKSSNNEEPKHWGHALSRNLVSWEEVDIAIYPSPTDSIWMGSSVLDPLNTTGFKPFGADFDPVIAIYTSKSDIRRQNLAVSMDQGMTFTHYEHNPVLADPRKQISQTPSVIFINDEWVMALAVYNRIEFYSSPNLKEWKLESEFGRNISNGCDNCIWDSVDLTSFEVDVGNGQKAEIWVLLVDLGVDPINRSQYFVGNFSKYDGNQYKFDAFEWIGAQRLDWGPDLIAPEIFSNTPDDRHVYFGWMNNWEYAHSVPTEPWRGQMSIPRELIIKVLDHESRKYRLTSKPIRELEDLRNPFQHFESSKEFIVLALTTISLTEGATFEVPTIELSLTLKINDNSKFSICAYNSESEETCFGHDRNQWYINREKSGNVTFSDRFSRLLHYSTRRESREETVNVTMFLDVSSIEVFVDDGLTTMTALHFPSKPFTKFYINNWARPSEESLVTVTKVEIWGLLCWYPKH